MQANLNQLSSTDIYSNIDEYFQQDKPKLIKLFDNLLRESKKLQKSNSYFNPHSYTYSKMPKESYANPEIKLSYINGHYCYTLKISIVTNGLGIIRDFDFFDKSTLDISKLATSSEAKDEYDAKSLVPTLDKFFNKRDFNYKYFLRINDFSILMLVNKSALSIHHIY